MQTLAQIEAVLNRVFERQVDQINRVNPILAGIRKGGIGTSQQIFLSNKMDSNHNAGPILDGADVTIGNPTTSYAAAQLPWSSYAATFSVPDRLLQTLTSQPSALGSLFETEITTAVQDLGDRIAADLYAGNVANGLVGMQSIFDDANTYAQLDRSLAANANWRSTVVDADDTGATELSTDLLYQFEREFHDRNGYDFYTRPNRAIFLPKDLEVKYKQLFETIDLSALGSAHFVNQANASGNLGYSSVTWQRSPIIPDRNVSTAAGDALDSGRMYFVDLDQVMLAQLTSNVPAAVVAQQQIDGARYAVPLQGLTPRIKLKGKLGERIEGWVVVYIQLVTKSPKRSGGVIKSLAI